MVRVRGDGTVISYTSRIVVCFWVPGVVPGTSLPGVAPGLKSSLRAGSSSRHQPYGSSSRVVVYFWVPGVTLPGGAPGL